MAQEILDFSKGVSSTNIEEVQFEDIMEGVLMFIEKDLTKNNVKLDKKLAFTGKLKLDQDKMARVFYNIASNARDAMPQGGTLTVLTEDIGGMVKIEFTDSGTGMPEEVKRRISNRSSLTARTRHGTRYVHREESDRRPQGKIEIEERDGERNDHPHDAADDAGVSSYVGVGHL